MQVVEGTYPIRIVPKSGWPVFGQSAVNSGQEISISYSRSGNSLGKVSSGGIGRLQAAACLGPERAPSRPSGTLNLKRIGPGGKAGTRRRSRADHSFEPDAMR